MKNGTIAFSRQQKGQEEDEDFARDELNDRPLSLDLNEEHYSDHEATEQHPKQWVTRTYCPIAGRIKLTNKSMLKGLVERTENYNKNVDRKVMTDSRIAFEDEQLKGRKTPDVTREMEKLAVSNQHIPTRGRGDSFGRLRSLENTETLPLKSTVVGSGSNTKMIPFAERINVILSNTGSGSSSRIVVSEEDNRSLSFQSPRRSTLASRLVKEGSDTPTKHHFDPNTAYRGKVVPDYRYSYNPQLPCPHKLPPCHGLATHSQSPIPMVRPGQRYPKRPENNPQQPSKPKHLNHEYYNIDLYGATQEERIAQRIEKTVRQTEAPARF